MILLTALTQESIAGDVAEAAEQATGTIESGLHELFTGLPAKAVFFGLKAIAALVLFLIGRKLIHVFERIIGRSMERAGTELTVRKFVKLLVKALGYVLLVLLILGVVGVQPTAFATVASSVTVALGLALQGSLGNFAGGLLILFMKPFKVGDYIIEDSQKNEGTVTNIGLVYTTMLTIDNREIVVPNGTLANSSLTNVTAQDKRLLEVFVGVAYETDLKEAKKVLEDTIKTDPFALSGEENYVYVSALSDSAVEMGCRIWVRTEDYWNCKRQINERLKTALDLANIEIPYGQLEVRMRRL